MFENSVIRLLVKSQHRLQARNQGGGISGICPLEIFKTLHSNFDIVETFKEQR